MPNPVPAAAPGLPAAILHEVHDCLVLALDATESTVGYTQPEREARSYIRSALRQADKLIGECAMMTPRSLDHHLADLQCKAAHANAVAIAVEAMLMRGPYDSKIIMGLASVIVMLTGEITDGLDAAGGAA